MADHPSRHQAAQELPTHRRRPAWLTPKVAVPGALAVLAVVAAATMFLISMADARANSGTFSLFAASDTGSARQFSEDRPMEVGVRFRVERPGTVTAVRFLKAPGDTSAHQ